MTTAILITLFALAFILAAAAKFLKRQPGDEYADLYIHGQLAPIAIVTISEPDPRGDRAMSYTFTIEGQVYSGQQTIDQGLAEAAQAHPDTLRVRYLPERPDVHRLAPLGQ